MGECEPGECEWSVATVQAPDWRPGHVAAVRSESRVGVPIVPAYFFAFLFARCSRIVARWRPVSTCGRVWHRLGCLWVACGVYGTRVNKVSLLTRTSDCTRPVVCLWQRRVQGSPRYRRCGAARIPCHTSAMSGSVAMMTVTMAVVGV